MFKNSFCVFLLLDGLVFGTNVFRYVIVSGVQKHTSFTVIEFWKNWIIEKKIIKNRYQSG